MFTMYVKKLSMPGENKLAKRPKIWWGVKS